MKKQWLLTLAMSVLLTGVVSFPAASYAETSQDTKPQNLEQSQNQIDEEYNEVDPELDEDFLDLLDYSDQLEAILLYEKKAFDSLNSISDSKGNISFTSSNRKSLYLKFTNTIVPNYTKYVSKLKQIKPDNPELQKIHATLIKGSYTQLEGYLLYQRSVSKTTINKTLLNQGRAKIKSSLKLSEQFEKELDAYISIIKEKMDLQN